MGRASRFAPACFAAACLLLLSLLALAGCGAINALSVSGSSSTVTPVYLGFKDQRVGVMAWADEALRFEHDALILDLTRSVSQKLQGAQARGAAELKGTTFPREKGPDAMYQFQMNHPELTADPITDVAPKLGVTRLIYIEVSNFDLHSGAVADLYRGSLTATVAVVEVANGKGKRTFNAIITASYPERSPEEGMPNLTDQQTYIGTVDQFSSELAKRFVAYPGE